MTINRTLAIMLFATIDAIALLVLGLWGLQNAPALATFFNAPESPMAIGAIRAASVAMLAGAQPVIVYFVIGRIGRRPPGLLEALLNCAAAVVFVGAIGATVAFAFAGR